MLLRVSFLEAHGSKEMFLFSEHWTFFEAFYNEGLCDNV